jgi:CRP-like cAMP-binding protein
MERMHGPAASGFALRDVTLLGKLTPTQRDAVAAQCHWQRMSAGDMVLAREDAGAAAHGQSVYLVVAGSVRVTTYSAAGRQVTFRDVASGDWIGEIAAIDGGPRSADIQALTEGLLAVVPRTLFLQLMQQHVDVLEQVLRRLTGLVRSLSQRVIDLSTLGVPQRLQAELLRLAMEAGIEGNRARIAPAPRHADMASANSTYREQVSREMSALQRAGLVGKEPGMLVVLDVQRLEALVQKNKAGLSTPTQE